MAKPPRCSICHRYHTTHPYFSGRRCLNPGHWQSAGLLAPDDYLSIAQLTAQAVLEQNQQRVIQGDQYEPVFGN